MATITKTIARDLPDGGYLEITAVERDGASKLSPGFSITGSLWEKRGSQRGRVRKRLGREQEAFGCLHDEINAAVPELAPLIDLHLADPTGLPMHAAANGWYFYSGRAAEYERGQIAAGRDYGYSRMLKSSDHDRAAQALRINPDQLPKGLDQQGFIAFLDSLAGTYQRQADAARALICSLTEDESLELRTA